eukprot:TRINITY_DN650_c0_g1_i6.p1 TRINITY_DN650_c0_g1~~TRINITY_DN650_c0_g1_i6.p1  ORF type:complete len:332 (-),score=171.72 TRINITY_DN650_c0_g1_i6:61-1056(-)
MPGYFYGPGNSLLNISSPIDITGQQGAIITCYNTKNQYAFKFFGSFQNISFSGFTIEYCQAGVIYDYTNVPRSAYFDNMRFYETDNSIVSQYTNLTVTNSVFLQVKNAISYLAFSTSQTKVDNCTFLNIQGYGLRSTYCVSPITITNSHFQGGRQSAIYSYSCPMIVDNCSFISNSDPLFGAAIFVNISSTFSINNSEFSYNIARSGGAIFEGYITLLTINNSNFFQNEASNGGAIFADSYMNLTNSYFYGNMAQREGGGFYCSNGQNVLRNVTFNGNGAPSSPAFGCYGCPTYGSDINIINSSTSSSCSVIPLEDEDSARQIMRQRSIAK